MKSKPKLLDLFCGAGGAAVGYARAGFEIVGVDIEPQPRYPFEFHRADALEFLATAGRDFDVIHASPPCQGYSSLRSIHRFRGKRAYPLLVETVLGALEATGLPYILENVPGANLPTHVTLCGSMFGLGAQCDGVWHQLRRHREFACSWYFLMPLRCRHVGRPVGVYGNGGGHHCCTPGAMNGMTGRASERREAMGIDWMDRYALSQAIPPAYTEWIGRRIPLVEATS